MRMLVCSSLALFSALTAFDVALIPLQADLADHKLDKCHGKAIFDPTSSSIYF